MYVNVYSRNRWLEGLVKSCRELSRQIVSLSEQFYRTCKPAQGLPLTDAGVLVDWGSGLFHIPFEYTSSLLSGRLGSTQRVEVCSSFVQCRWAGFSKTICIYLIRLQQKWSGASELDYMRVGLWYSIISVICRSEVMSSSLTSCILFTSEMGLSFMVYFCK